nr:TrbG/VirB9 family P-type conjugative transfer protein [Sphingomonas sp. TDK1]
MADKCRDFESLLADTSPTPLSLYEHNGNLFSQPMEVLHFILTGDRIRVPLLNGRLGQALYTSRVIFGREAAEIRLPDKSHWLGMFGVREYVATTRTGQFNSLLTLDFPFVLTQSFAPLVKSVASERFTKKYKQMVSSDDAGVSQAMELLDGVDDLMANRFVLGEHHLSIAVMDDDKRRLLDRLSIARSAAADTGMVMAREDVALEAAFWAQLPGNFKMRARPAVINSRNFAALSPFYTFPAGRKSGTRNMNYTVQGDSSLQPTEISDNGEFTVLRYPGHADIPSIFAVDVDGTETIVPYDVREDFVVIHAVYRQLRLRRGNVVLCIYNEAPPRNDRGDRTGTVSNIVERKVKGQ